VKRFRPSGAIAKSTVRADFAADFNQNTGLPVAVGAWGFATLVPGRYNRTRQMKLAVLNPRGRDPEQHFPDGAGDPDEKNHAPVNYHAFAACTGGGFYRKETSIPVEENSVLLLLRSDLQTSRQGLIELRRGGKKVAVAFKEAGTFQIADLLAQPSRLRLFQEICRRAHGAIATTPDLTQFYRSAGVPSVEFIPTPYPVEDPRWDFSRPDDERRGIFLGTREFGTVSRNHLAALLTIRPLAEALQEPVTVINDDGWRGRRLLKSLRWPDELLRTVEQRLPYPRYLELIARHKLVFQLDASGVPGQVAGDALLCRIPCVGGDGATERLVFPTTCGYGRGSEQLFDIAARLMEHPHDRARVVEESLSLARERLSFAKAHDRLTEFFARVGH
jgi:hypothetical protein